MRFLHVSCGELKMTTRKTSKVWDYFELEGNGNVFCKLCNVKLAYNNFTGAMRNHIQYRHAGAPLRILGPLDSIFTRALLPSGGGVWLGMPRDIPLGRNRDCVPEPVFFFPLLPNQIILFQLLQLFSFVCNWQSDNISFWFFIKLI